MHNPFLSIADVEQETGIKRDTLRIWERRYGFPAPARNQRRERVYTSKQLDRLRLLKQLLDRGMQPGKLIKLDDQQLRQLTVQQQCTAAVPADVGKLLETLASGPRYALLPLLELMLRQHGLRSFVTDVVAPMNQAVGDAWFTGKIGVLDEHLYAEAVRRVLTTALSGLPLGSGDPRVLLTTLPGEPHSIGLLMSACMLSLEGAEILLLGTQTPLEEIVRGAAEGQCSVVGISCSELMGRRAIASQLVRLRKLLPEKTLIWAGGSGAGAIRFPPENVKLFTDLRQIPAAIQELKQQTQRTSNRKTGAAMRKPPKPQ